MAARDTITAVQPLLVVYVAGVLVGLWRADAPTPRRMALALLWPVGVMAAAVTISILLIAAAILFPLVGVVMLGTAGVGWWMLR